jgi:hypothetical protein
MEHVDGVGIVGYQWEQLPGQLNQYYVTDTHANFLQLRTELFQLDPSPLQVYLDTHKKEFECGDCSSI